MFRGEQEKSQFNLVLFFTGPTFSHNSDNLSTVNPLGSHVWIGDYKRCCYFLCLKFLLWNRSLVPPLHSGVCTRLLVKIPEMPKIAGMQ